MAPSFAERMPAGPAFAICFLAFQLFALAMGYGPALLLLPRAARRDALALAPVLGFCVLVTAGWHLMFVGPAGTDRQWPWLLGLGVALAAAGVAVRRRELRETFDRDVAWLALCAAAGVVLYAHATMAQPHLTAAAQNNDISSYSTVERQLQDLPGDTLAGPTDQFGLVQFARLSVTGAYLPTAFLSSALGVRTYQLQTVCLASYLFWGALLAGVFARRVLGFRTGGAMLVSLVAGAAPIPLYTAWCAFKSSLAGTALMMAMLAIAVPAFGAPEPERPLRRAPAMALLAFGLMLAYPHMLPLVWALLGGLAVARAATERRWAPARDGAVLLGSGLVGAAALSPARVWITADYVLLAKAAAAGFPVRPLTLLSVLGLSGTGPEWALPVGPAWAIAAGIAAFALVLWGLGRTFADDRQAAITATALLLIIGLGYLVLRLAPGPLEVEGYKPFKLVSFFYPAVLACLSMAFRTLALPAGAWAARARVGGAAGVAVAVALLSGAASAERRRTLPFASADEADLQRLERDPRIESINIVSPSFWDAMWQIAFLVRKPLFLKHPTYYPRSPRLAGAWDLVHAEPGPSEGVLAQAPPDPASVVPVNATYLLRRHEAVVSVEYANGWSVPEPDHRWTSERRATLLVDTGIPRRVLLALRYTHYTPGTTFEVRLDDRPIGTCLEPRSCSLGPLDLAAGTHVLAFDGSNPPHVAGPVDKRLLGTAFFQVQFSPAPAADPP